MPQTTTSDNKHRLAIEEALASIAWIEGPIKEIEHLLCTDVKNHLLRGGQEDFCRTLWPSAKQTLNSYEGLPAKFQLNDEAKTTIDASRFSYRAINGTKMQIVIVNIPVTGSIDIVPTIICSGYKPIIKSFDRKPDWHAHAWQLWKPRWQRDASYAANHVEPVIFRSRMRALTTAQPAQREAAKRRSKAHDQPQAGLVSIKTAAPSGPTTNVAADSAPRKPETEQTDVAVTTRKRRPSWEDLPAEGFVADAKDKLTVTNGELAQHGITMAMINNRADQKAFQPGEERKVSVQKLLGRNEFIVRDWTLAHYPSSSHRNLLMYCLWAAQEESKNSKRLQALSKHFTRDNHRRNTQFRIDTHERRFGQHMALATELVLAETGACHGADKQAIKVEADVIDLSADVVDPIRAGGDWEGAVHITRRSEHHNPVNSTDDAQKVLSQPAPPVSGETEHGEVDEHPSKRQKTVSSSSDGILVASQDEPSLQELHADMNSNTTPPLPRLSPPPPCTHTSDGDLPGKANGVTPVVDKDLNKRVQFCFVDPDGNTAQEASFEECGSAADLLDVACEAGIARKNTRSPEVRTGTAQPVVIRKDNQKSFEMRVLDPLHEVLRGLGAGDKVMVTVKEYMRG